MTQTDKRHCRENQELEIRHKTPLRVFYPHNFWRYRENNVMVSVNIIHFTTIKKIEDILIVKGGNKLGVFKIPRPS